MDKYSASESVRAFLIWLIESGQAEIIEGSNSIVTFNPYSGERTTNFSSISAEGCLEALRSYRDRYSFSCKFKAKIYTISFGDGDSLSYSESYGGIEEEFREHVQELKEKNQYYLPGTEIPRYEAPGSGAGIVAKGNNKYMIADRENVYSEFEGKAIFNKSFVISEDKSFVYSNGEQEIFDDILYRQESQYTDTLETLIAYNKEKIIFIVSNRNESIGKEEIKEFNREDREKPVSMFSTETISGFIDGKKIRLTGRDGNVSIFEIEEEIKSIDIRKNYILINNNIICCMVNTDRSSTLVPFCKKIDNLEFVKNYLENVNNLSLDYVIENDKGCFFTKNLSENEILELYEKNGFIDLLNNLKERIKKREDEEKKKMQEKIENNERLSAYLDLAQSILVPVVFSNPDGEFSDEMDDSNIYDANTHEKIGARYYMDNPNVQALYGIQEKGWYGEAYRGMAINVKMVKRMVRGGKLHLDVPQEAMGRIIGIGGHRINMTTEALRKKGVDVSRIILHPKTPEEMKVKLEQIKSAIEKNKQRGH